MVVDLINLFLSKYLLLPRYSNFANEILDKKLIVYSDTNSIQIALLDYATQ